MKRKELEMINLAEAISIAAEAHKNQTDKQGRPYILHCLHVMRGVKRFNNDNLSITAVLHDLIEDTDWELDPFDGLWLHNKKLDYAVKLPLSIYEALHKLTHWDGKPYNTYIADICKSQNAIKVKMADLEHNSQIFRLKGLADKDVDRMIKYHNAYVTLKGHLEVAQ